MSTSTSTPSHERQVQVDPSLLDYGGGRKDVPIDPALFAMEQVVNDVRKGKIKLEERVDEEARRPGQGQVDEPGPSAPQVTHGDAGGGMDLMDEEFDPALREIVNSLTNAQQSTSSLGTNLTQAQAQAAIDAHLSDDIDHGIAFKTLEDLERAGFGMLNEHYGSTSDSFLLPEGTQAGTSDVTPAPPSGDTSPYPAGPSSAATPGPRRRGRPKGSKNKAKPGPPPPPPPPKPAKKRGRPPKKRTEEELAEIERQRLAKEHGYRKPKGRPRKFPGYLVREMRLKKNRAEITDLLRRHGEMERIQAQHGDGAGEEGEAQDQEDHGQGGFWTDGMEQSILAAVEGLEGPGPNHHHETHMDVGVDQGGDEDVPSSRAFEGGGDEMEMRRVFGLPSETEHDDGAE